MTPRQRAFVANLAAGMCGAEAARRAGYAHAARAAHRLRRDPAVQAALAVAAATKAETLQQLEECRRVAIAHGDAGAAVRAVELRSQLVGLVA